MPKSICLATVQLAPLEIGGIGSYYLDLAKLLSSSGWHVAVLVQHAGDIRSLAHKYEANYGFSVYNADSLIQESGQNIAELTRDCWSWAHGRSHIFHSALSILADQYDLSFDLVEFPDWGAAGFIPLQTHRTLRWLEGTRIIVKLHGPTEWVCEGSRREWSTFDEQRLEYLERYAFENADIQVSPSHYLLDWCRERYWRIRTDATICPYPCSVSSPFGPEKEITKRNEIVFFGRLEYRKGLMEFIDALRYIDATDPSVRTRYQITLLGEEVAPISRSYVSVKLSSFKLTFHTLSRDDAIAYLMQNARLVVIPSRFENFPNTLLECMLGNIPVVTSRSGGIPEILGVGTRLYDSVSCDVDDPRNLAELIQKYLRYEEDKVRQLLSLAYRRGVEVTNRQNILRWYESCLRKQGHRPRSHSSKSSEEVTVIVPTRNATEYFQPALTSLMNQTYKPIKIIIKDSSTDSEAIRQLRQVQKDCPDVQIVRTKDRNLGNALNQALAFVKTKYFIQCDADNISKPEMVEDFVKCIKNRKDVVALSSYNAIFTDEDQGKLLANLYSKSPQDFPARKYYKPVGPHIPLMFFENTQGDANSIYLTSAVKAVGGWPEDDRALYDWGLWLKLIGSGYRTDVIPKVLYYYRWRSESDTAVKSVFEVEESNIKAVQNIVEKSPKLFSRHYRALHRLVRSPSQTTGWRLSKQTDELMAQPEGLGGLPVLPEGATMDVWFKSGIGGKALHALSYYYLYSRRWGRRAAIRKMMRDGLRRRI